jgi:hypothetical protein
VEGCSVNGGVKLRLEEEFQAPALDLNSLSGFPNHLGSHLSRSNITFDLPIFQNVFAQHSAGMQHYLNQPSIPQKEGREATDYGFRYPPPLVREVKIPTHFQGLCAHYLSNQLANNDLERDVKSDY